MDNKKRKRADNKDAGASKKAKKVKQPAKEEATHEEESYTPDQIRELEAGILADINSKNLNDIPLMLKVYNKKGVGLETQLCIMGSLTRIFEYFIQTKQLSFVDVENDENGDNEGSKTKSKGASNVLNEWKLKMYNLFRKQILQTLSKGNGKKKVSTTTEALQKFALQIGMKLAEKEHKHFKSTYKIANNTLYLLLKQLLVVNNIDDNNINKNLLHSFSADLKIFEDKESFTCSILHNLSAIIKEYLKYSKKQKASKETNANTTPTLFGKEDSELYSGKSLTFCDRFLFVFEKLNKTSKFSPTVKKAFSEFSITFMTCQFSEPAYMFLLNKMQAIIKNFTKPFLLVDFLNNAFSQGGLISFLSLSGLFELMTKHNMDYPKFYEQLYSIITPDLFRMHNRSEFYDEIQLFLSSSYLPAYMVAAFIKRFARLGLTAPSHALPFLLHMIYNLLYRHPNCLPLINHPTASAEDKSTTPFTNLFIQETVKEEKAEILAEGDKEDEEDKSQDTMDRNSSSILKGTDPYNFNEKYMEKCGASDSTLWELKALYNHFCPSIVNMAKIFQSSLQKPPFELDQFMKYTFKKLFETEVLKKTKTKPAVEFNKKTTLFDKGLDDSFDCWDF